MKKERTLIERIEQLEFKQRLLFDNTSVDRLLFEYDVTQEQYKQIMDLMEVYRKRIGNGEVVSNDSFETEVYRIVPEHDGNYHFAEHLTRAFMNDKRWEEVFPALYGDMPKYGGGNFKL